MSLKSRKQVEIKTSERTVFQKEEKLTYQKQKAKTSTSLSSFNRKSVVFSQ
jgi:hypothetical protein